MKMSRWSGAAAVVACAFAALPAAASANVQVGSSGWLWGNPLPQGNTLRAMTFSGPTGYAVGDFGTLLKTTDAGDTWTGLPAGTFSNLTEVQTVDANTVVAGGGCVARISKDGGTSFSRIAFTPVESSCPDGSRLASIWYVNANHGYLALTDGSIFETVDGIQFATKTALPGTRQAGGGVVPTDLVFVSDTSGFAGTTDGNIFQTTDSGVTWKSVSNTSRPVKALTFATDKIGYAVGDQSLFLKTTDGGATWNAKDIGGTAPQNLTAVRCADEKTCVVTTAAGTLLGITTDGGTTFAFPTPSTDPMLAAGFATATRLAAAGQQGSTVVSDDTGANFRPIGGRLTGKFTRIVAGKVAGSAYAPGPNATLGKTVDGGKTWTRGNVTTTADVLDVSFPTVNDGYALDVSGGVFRTSSGGQFWKTLDTGSTARPGAVYAPSAETVMVVGPTGIRRSTDGGGSFAAVKGDAVARTELGAVDRAGSAIVAYGAQDVIRSVDNGKTWKTIKKPGKYVKRGKKLVNRLGIRNADFIDANNGFLLDTSGRLFRTKNGGKAWTELPGVGTSAARGMSFSSAQKGYLVISTFGDVRQSTGFLLRTDDGGATWHPQFVVSNPIADDGVAAGGATDYLLGGEQSLLYSTTGGDSGSSSDLTITAPKTRYTKPAHIVVTGKLKPASGNERVTVAYRKPGSTSWRTQTVTVSANGSFTSSWNLARGANVFVAQWQGDFRSHGDGSKVLTVTVGKGK
ncbi:MAG TPA: YCF48-related protein [Baekduia sp.]|uniref:WD40/YVTN/BNR-like repeat-containing protein n=1 Tax=Baekduia sp. TaxID=2600305 RepID=UPI002C24D753|nr:YCF48-related protein [Baekduia sp.]HMJ35717.1 YCF48-related protein [Baekduia sp.]